MANVDCGGRTLSWTDRIRRPTVLRFSNQRTATDRPVRVASLSALSVANSHVGTGLQSADDDTCSRARRPSSCVVNDRNPSTDGNSPLLRCRTYWFAPLYDSRSYGSLGSALGLSGPPGP